MLFEVQTDKETVTLTLAQLVQLISPEVLTKTKPEAEMICDAIASSLSANEVLHRTSFIEYGTLAFMFGYYYRIFLEKNNVTIKGTKNEDGSSEDGGEGSRTRS